jgi:hypothetical protein
MPITKQNANKFKKEELKFDPRVGWPNGDDLFYQCLVCGDFVCSVKEDECQCRNVYVDAAAGRAGAKDEQKVRLVKFLDS